MPEVQMPHPNHDDHLCWLVNMGYQRQCPEEYKGLVRDPKFVCKGCGRVAAEEKNLCDPVELGSWD